MVVEIKRKSLNLEGLEGFRRGFSGVAIAWPRRQLARGNHPVIELRSSTQAIWAAGALSQAKVKPKTCQLRNKSSKE